MMLKHFTIAGVLIFASITAACGGKNPVEPSPPSQPAPNSPASPNVAAEARITNFTITGWYDGTFHYQPAFDVKAPDAGDIYVSGIEFRDGNADAKLLLGMRFASVRIPAGSSMHLPQAADSDITLSTALSSLTVKIFVTDDGGWSANVAAEAAAPDLSQDRPVPALVIQEFSVRGSVVADRFYYRPKLTLAETSGRSRALIRKITFELLDVGPAGRVPALLYSYVVPAGGTLTLVQDDDGYGLLGEIDSLADARRVSVVISFLDDAGRGATVSAIAPVSR